MRHCIIKHSFLKILFTVVFTLVFNNKSSANVAQTYTHLITESFSINNLNNDGDLEIIDDINSDECEEEGEDCSNDFSIVFQDENVSIKKDVTFKNFNAHQFYSENKRYYILYCQLKIHL